AVPNPSRARTPKDDRDARRSARLRKARGLRLQSPMKLRLVCVLVALSACDSDITSNGSSGDAPVVPNAPTIDAGIGNRDGAAPACDATRPCPSGQVCLSGQCVSNACPANSGVTCSADSTCVISCIPTNDPCAGVSCPSGQTCDNGQCVPGCFRVPCNGV